MTPGTEPNPEFPNSPRGRAQAARLTALALIIFGRGRTTGEELASKLGVTVRTVYRDIERLQRAGLDVVSVPGPSGGFVLGGGATESGQSADKTLLDLLSRLGLIPRDEATLDRVIGLASEVVDDSDIRLFRNAAQRILFDPEEWYARDRTPTNWSVLRDAVLYDHRLHLSFSERTGPEVVNDAFDPLGLIWKGGTWYLFGYSHSGKCYRRVRLQRVREAHDTGEVFSRPACFDLLQAWRADLEAFGKGCIRVVLRIGQAAISEFENFNWKRENRIHKAMDHWLVEMDVDRFEWLVPLVLSYGGEVTVENPPELSAKVAAAARKVLESHRSTKLQESQPESAQGDDSRARAAMHRRTGQD